jgi:hypothetical protein
MLVCYLFTFSSTNYSPNRFLISSSVAISASRRYTSKHGIDQTAGPNSSLSAQQCNTTLLKEQPNTKKSSFESFLTSISNLDDVLVVAAAGLGDQAHLRRGGGGGVAGEVRGVGRLFEGRDVGDGQPQLVFLLLQEGGLHRLAQL